MAMRSGVNRPKLVAEEHRRKVPDMYCSGMTLKEIGAELGVSYETVRKDLMVIYSRWVEEGKKQFDEFIRKELIALDRIESEAWAAWEESKKPLLKTVESDLNNSKSATTQTGDPRFLAEVRSCLQRRAKLLGYDKPELRDVTSGGSPVSVNVVFGE
jgi:hypothetical protein